MSYASALLSLIQSAQRLQTMRLLRVWGVANASEDPNMAFVCQECFDMMLIEAPSLFTKKES